MASTPATDILGSTLKVQMWDHDPGGTDATVVSPDGGTTERWLDMRDYDKFAVAAMSSTLNGNGITKVEIVAADDTDGTNTVVVKDSGAVVADAVGDWVFEECTEHDVREVADSEQRYVAGRITVADAADEAVVTYIATPKRAFDGLTPDTTIA